MIAQSVNNILKENLEIHTLIDTCCFWQVTTITKIENNEIYIPLLDFYINKLLLEGNTLILKYTGEFYEYIFTTIVNKIILDPPSSVVLRITNYCEKINTRAFIRYDIYLPANIKSMSEKASYFSIITNISLNGMAFSSNHNFEVDSECTISLHLPNRNIIHLSGIIKHKVIKETMLDYGLQFNQISENNTQILSDYILSLKSGNNRLNTKFFIEDNSGKEGMQE